MNKIVQVLYSGLGGHASVAFSLLNTFAQNGFINNFVFYGIEPLPSTFSKYLDQRDDVEMYFSIQKKTKLGIVEWYNFFICLKKTSPNIILLHSPQLILVAYFYSLFKRTKIVTVEHDSLSIRTKKKWLITNLNSILADKGIVLTEHYRKSLKEHLWFKGKASKYLVIPNGIDIQQYQQKREYWKHPHTTVFMASRMNSIRDHDTLIQAVLGLNESNHNIKLRIAGDGETRKRLETTYSSEAIIFLGHINESQLIEELLQTDIYVHSTLAETFSTAILQAMSVGLPIIATDIEGVTHMIKNRTNGFTFAPGDIEQLKKCIADCIGNKETAQSIGCNARRNVEELYSIQYVVSQYIKTFNA